MAEYQDITGIKIAQAAMTTAYVVIYTSPTDTRTYVKDIMIGRKKLRIKDGWIILKRILLMH